MDYSFLLSTDIIIILLLIGWLMFVYCVFRYLDGIKKKIVVILLTPVVFIYGPHMLLAKAVHDITMYDYYRASITYKFENEFSADYYEHIDDNGKPDGYARRIQDGMAHIDDNIADVGRKYGFGVPDKPEFEALGEKLSPKYWSLFWDSAMHLYGIPLLPLVLLGLIMLYRRINQSDSDNLYSYNYVNTENDYDDKEQDYRTLTQKIKDAEKELDSLEEQKTSRRKEIDDIDAAKKKKVEEYNQEIEKKELKLKQVTKDLEEKIAQDEFFSD